MKKILILGIGLGFGLQGAFAGNPDRKGEAGAQELNINGYARSAGFWDLNCAGVKGLEAERLNPAGLGYTQSTEIIAAYTSWLTGSGVNIVQGGIASRIKSNAFAVSINSLNLGAIDRTTTAAPGGEGLGTFKPTFFNIGVSYAKNFSLGSNKTTGDNLITGGVSVRLISEIIQNLSATGLSLDVGLQYTTGVKENVHFGVSLRNIGTTMRFSGDALNYTAVTESGTASQTVDKRTNTIELPTQLNMGASYDLYFGPKIELSTKKYAQNYRVTFLGQYSANAFGLDNYGLGAEFSLREMFMIRAAYRMETGIFSKTNLTTAYNGLAAGLSINIPFKKKDGRMDNSGPAIGLDYGFRMTSSTNNFQHTHTAGIRVNLGGAEKQKVIDNKGDVAPSAYDDSKTTVKESKKKGKKGKVSEEELEAKEAAIDSLVKANQALKIKSETPVVKIDTVIKRETVMKHDTILVPTVLEKSEYKGGQIDTVSRGGKKTLQFNDYEALEFETGSAKINPKSYQYLNYLVNIMKQNPGYVILFEGHTDNVGDEEKNQKLSQDRVDAIKSYFETKGIAGNRINTKAFGSKKPKYKNDTAAGRAKNRRVEVFMEM
jgi:outer membrane protein OmpA-like peptidoglycan-associated protein